MNFSLLFWVFVITTGCTVEAAKILVISATIGYSHYHVGVLLSKFLVEKGHEVSLVSRYGKNEPGQKYRDITVGFEEAELKNHAKRIQQLSAETSIWKKLMSPYSIHKKFLFSLEQTLKHTEFQKLIKSNESFDLVILEDFMSTALKYAAYKFKAPLIIYSALDTNDHISTFQGSPDNPACTSHFQLEYLTEKSFLERLLSSIHYVITKFVLHQFLIPEQNELLQKYFPEAPHINEFIYNVSLVFMNSDISVNDAVPRVPSMINIGGFHIADPKPLPAELNALLDEAQNGFIYFSLGTNFRSEFLSPEKISLLMRAFSKMKILVLWKLEADIPNAPKNVIVKKWFPQIDIFAHKNLKLFITQCGIFSMMEAVFFGVPMLAFPMIGDQKGNAKRAEAYGYAKQLSMEDLDEKQLMETISDLINNPRYSQTARKYSKIMHDKLIPPKETVAFWVDYIVRNKGAEHLRVASLKLAWYQYLLLDVVVFILLILAAAALFLKYLVFFNVKKVRKIVKTKIESKLKRE